FHPFRDFVNVHLGVAYLLDGDPEAARDVLSTLLRAHGAKEHRGNRGNRGDRAHLGASLLYIGGAMHFQGRLEDALRLCQRAADHAEATGEVDQASGAGEAGDGDPRVWAAADLVMGRTLYERNELEAAVRHLRASESARFAQAASLGEGVP